MATNVPQVGAPLSYVDDDAPLEDGGVATIEQPEKVEPTNAYDFDDGSEAEEAAEVAAEHEATETPVAKAGDEKAKEGQTQDSPEIDSGLKDLLGRAEEYGFSKEDAEAMPPAALLRAMATIDRQFAAMGRKTFESQQPAKQPEKAPEKPVEKPAEAPASESDLRLSEEEFDPGLVKFSGSVEARFAALEKQLQAVQAENAQLRKPVEQAQAREASELDTKMDTFFNGLGDEYADVFGQGSLQKMASDSTAAKARVEVWQEMVAIQAGRQAAGRALLPFEECQQRALISLHPDKIKIQARKEVEQKVALRKKGSIAKPTSKIGKPLSRMEAAAAFAERFAKEAGVADSVDDDGDV